MELSDEILCSNFDWDPGYLSFLFSEDFNDFSDLWSSNVSDGKLLKEMDKVECYAPIVEDISLDDDILCHAVEKIESE